MERKILLFAKLMSICFAGIGLFSLIDTWLTPESQIQYVLAHESEMGYRSSSKYGANHYRDNYLHCIPFRSRMPYHLRTTGEIDTLLTYADVAVRYAEAQQMQQEQQQQEIQPPQEGQDQQDQQPPGNGDGTSNNNDLGDGNGDDSQPG